jgi:hypothetical protein
MGIQREEDGKTIKQTPDGKVLTHVYGHDATLFTGRFLSPEETQSKMPETLLPVDPADLIPIDRSIPVVIPGMRNF